MSKDNLRVYVHLGYGFDAARFKERFARGESIEYTPYDFHLAERPGVTVSFSSDGEGRAPGRLARALNRRLHFALDHAWYNRRAIAASDVVWTMGESEAFALAALMLFRLVPQRPIIGNAIWLFNNWSRLSAFNRVLFRQLSRNIDVLTVHSEKCLAVAAESGLNTQVEVSLFGINEAAYPPLPPASGRVGPIRVLAAGNDWTRDWPLLLAALGNDERFVISAWTSVLGKDDLAKTRNLRLPKPATLEAVRQMYADADVVAVPMIVNLYSGITVALEAAAQGRPVVATATGGIPTYFAEDEVRYTPPNDAAGLSAAVLEARSPGFAAMAQRARKRYVAGDYTTRGMIDRYLALTRRVLNIPEGG